MRGLIVLMLSLFVVLAASPGAWAAEDKVIGVSPDDAEMNAAIAKARASLGEFWREFASPGKGVDEFCLKVRISDGRNTEHFWLREIKRNGAKISGVIDNDPTDVKTVKLGQRYEFTEADISDWSFQRNGKIVGNETMRPLLAKMPPDEAQYYRDMLETPPPAK